MTPIDEKKPIFLDKVQKTVEQYGMLSYGDSVLVGLSGGADSVALLRVMLALREEYGLQISCAHVNHGLRGECAERDAEFAKALCKEQGVPLCSLEENVKAYATRHGLSVEEAGREVRYLFFKEQKTDKIAVAHTMDDTAETVLMNLLKGNLPLGIPPKRDNIIRPLLAVSKEEIFTYLEEIGQPYVTDETNFSKEYFRNRIRLDVIPYFSENFNKNFTNIMYHTADVLWQEQNFLDEVAADFLNHNAVFEKNLVRVSKMAVASSHIAVARKAIRQCYYRCLGENGRISYEQINRLITLCKRGQSGQKVELPNKICAELSGGWLIFSHRREVSDFSYSLSFGKWVTIAECGYAVCLSREEQPCDFCYPIRVEKEDAVLVRNKRNGDKIYFANRNIHKKVSDFLSEKKVPSTVRNEIPLIAVNEEIRVITGYFWESVWENKAYILIKNNKGN